MSACRATLCFNAVDLDAFFRDWESRRTSAADPMPNPALVLKRAGGAALDADALVPTLDADTESALRWQVQMWREVGELHEHATLNTTEQCFLQRIVLPAIMKRISDFRDTSAVGRWWRDHTPGVVRTALSWGTNAMAYLLDHPWVQWLTLWLAKGIRMWWCLCMFGISPDERDALKRRIKAIMLAKSPHPLLNVLVDILGIGLSCVSGDVVNCIRNGVSAIFSTTTNVLLPFTSFVVEILRMCANLLGLPGDAMSKLSIPAMRDATMYEWGSHILNSVGLTADIETDMKMLTETRANGYILPLQREMRLFYNMNTVTLGRTFVLWFMRRLPVAHLFSLMDRIELLFPRIKGLNQALRTVINKTVKLRNNHAKAYDIILSLMDNVHFLLMLQQYYDLICVIGNLLGCAVVVVFSRIPGFSGVMDKASCCTQQVFNELEQVRVSTIPMVRPHN